MFTKLAIVLALAAVALSAEYPPGVHPAVCPNYPYCDTALLARYTPDGQPIPEWVYNPFILPHGPVAPVTIAKPEEISELALKYPAAINPAICPNYPYCDTALLARYTPDGQPIPEWVYNPFVLPHAPIAPVTIAKPADVSELALKYPAAINPALCPNYPYCDSAILPHYFMNGRLFPELVHTLSPLTPSARTVSVAVPKPTEPMPEAAKYPADFDSSLCPNYPYCE